MQEDITKQDDQDHWHLDKRVNVSHLFATFSVISGLVIWGMTVESRLAVLETRSVNNHEVMKEMRNDIRAIRTGVEEIWKTRKTK